MGFPVERKGRIWEISAEVLFLVDVWRGSLDKECVGEKRQNCAHNGKQKGIPMKELVLLFTAALLAAQTCVRVSMADYSI